MNRFGVRLSPDQQWMMKTNPPSIAFVNQAEFYLSRDDLDLSKDQVRRLKDHIEKIKNGELVLENFIEIEDFLNGNYIQG